MKQTELRLGNYITVHGHLQEVVELPLPENCTDENTKPIPLTEEWLLKFGFIKCMGRHGEYFKHKEFDAFRVWYNEDLNSWSFGRKDYESIDKEYNTYWIRDNVTSVHLLQNIFYFLTGWELVNN